MFEGNRLESLTVARETRKIPKIVDSALPYYGSPSILRATARLDCAQSHTSLVGPLA
jgi:hypothetical protein